MKEIARSTHTPYVKGQFTAAQSLSPIGQARLSHQPNSLASSQEYSPLRAEDNPSNGHHSHYPNGGMAPSGMHSPLGEKKKIPTFLEQKSNGGGMKGSLFMGEASEPQTTGASKYQPLKNS